MKKVANAPRQALNAPPSPAPRGPSKKKLAGPCGPPLLWRIPFGRICGLGCLFLAITLPLTAQEVTIDISWDRFNPNQYEGLLILPKNNAGENEYIGGFKASRSKDGHVILGKSDGIGVSSLNQIHWEITRLKRGIYKLFLFCKAGGGSGPAQWSKDVRVLVNINGQEEVFVPNKTKGEVWDILYINGGTGQIEERQIFYPLRHLIYGFTKDALTGEPLSGVGVQLFDAVTGKPIPDQETVSEKTGFYALGGFSLGRYIVRYEAKDHIPLEERTDFILMDLPRQINPVLSPLLKETQFRVTLEWGASPRDLDAHLLGPGPSGKGSFHISWHNMHEFRNRHFLDIDDTDKFGPETITLGGLDRGTYTYTIHDYSNREARANTWNLANSQAIVRLYRGNSMIQKFAVPEMEGNMWRVFTLNGRTGQVEIIDEMAYESDSQKVY